MTEPGDEIQMMRQVTEPGDNGSEVHRDSGVGNQQVKSQVPVTGGRLATGDRRWETGETGDWRPATED